MNLFVSGALMFRELAQAVTGGIGNVLHGELHGYAQFKLKDSPLSAVIPFPDRSVEGVIYLDLSDEAVDRVAGFLGKACLLEEVTVEGEHGEWTEASLFILKPAKRKLLTTREWDEDEYRDNHLKKALASCRK